MAAALNIFILSLLFISSYFQVYIGAGYFESCLILLISFFTTWILLRYLFQRQIEVKLSEFSILILLFLVLWTISRFPPIYDDEFAYVATLPRIYCDIGKIKSLDNIGFFSYIYQGYESGLTVFECLKGDINSLRLFNILILVSIFSIFIEKNKSYLSILVVLTAPIIASNGLILKNDILAGYLLLAGFYFLFFKKENYIFLGFSSLILLGTLKPIFILDAIPIVIIYAYTNFEIVRKNYKTISLITLLTILPWVIKNYLEFGEPLFPILELPGFDLDYKIIPREIFLNYTNLIKENFYGINNFSLLNGSTIDFIHQLFKRFGYLYIAVLAYSIFTIKKVKSLINIVLIISVYLFSLWELRYHIGIVLIALLYINMDNIYKYLLIMISLPGIIDSGRIFNSMYVQKSQYYFLNGYQDFKVKYMAMNDNNELINFLNKNSNNKTIIIDNSIFYYLDKSINYYWIGPTNLIKFNNLDFDNFSKLLHSKNIKYIVLADDSIQGYYRFGYSLDKIPNTINYYEKLESNISLLLNKNNIKYVAKYGRSVVYEVKQ